MHLELLRVGVEARDQYLRAEGVVCCPPVATWHHEPQVLRVGAREGQVVPPPQRDGGMEGHQALQAAVAAAVERTLVIPSRVHKVDVAASGEGHRYEGARLVVLVHAFYDKPCGGEGGVATRPCVPSRVEGAPRAVGAVAIRVATRACVRHLLVRLTGGAARWVERGLVDLASRAVEPLVEKVIYT